MMIIKVIDMIIMIIEAAVIAIVKDTEVDLVIEIVKEDQDPEPRRSSCNSAIQGAHHASGTSAPSALHEKHCSSSN